MLSSSSLSCRGRKLCLLWVAGKCGWPDKHPQHDHYPALRRRVTANGFEYLHRNSVPMMLDMDAAEQEEVRLLRALHRLMYLAAGRASQDSMEASLAFFANKDGRAVSRFGGGSSSSSSSSSSNDPNVRRVLAFQATVGRKLLERIESPDGPLSALERELLAIQTAQLDVIRAGSRVLLGALQRLGKCVTDKKRLQ
eukprot:287911-Pelagomonas_calceolata.AAC.5